MSAPVHDVEDIHGSVHEVLVDAGDRLLSEETRPVVFDDEDGYERVEQ
jgi:hypothetical protein